MPDLQRTPLQALMAVIGFNLLCQTLEFHRFLSYRRFDRQLLLLVSHEPSKRSTNRLLLGLQAQIFSLLLSLMPAVQQTNCHLWDL